MGIACEAVWAVSADPVHLQVSVDPHSESARGSALQRDPQRDVIQRQRRKTSTLAMAVAGLDFAVTASRPWMSCGRWGGSLNPESRDVRLCVMGRNHEQVVG